VPPATSVLFPPFRLDLTNERLWRGAQPIHLRPKTFAILRCLVEHPGQLLSRAALFDAVWPDVMVSDVVLTGCIRELRRALQDDPKHPQFIETVHRRGYRFIGPIIETSESTMPYDAPQPVELFLSTGTLEHRRNLRSGLVLGRDREIACLLRWLAKALDGMRQVVFVTGEAGIGKTTVVDAFVARALRLGGLWIGRGQCIEQYGASEPYMPVLQALEGLCRIPESQRVAVLLSQHAPTWLAQIPGLRKAGDEAQFQPSTFGMTRERMLRELATALEVLTAEQPLILVLEDLHWSDYASLDLLSMLARRREPARLLLLGTYRPEEVREQRHPLYTAVQELRIQAHCEELPLRGLSEADVRAYLEARVAGTPLPDGLARFIHQRTDGNPLFMVAMIEDALPQILAEQSGGGGWSEDHEKALGIPESLRQLLVQRFERLSPEEQQVLEVGSVIGIEFLAVAVAEG
jgi:DNA-binding winged helix-turn-helix (wHTH) protein